MMKLQFTQVKKVMGLFVIPAVMTIGSHVAQAQLKVGASPATITPNAVLDVQGTTGSHSVILQNGNAGFGVTDPGQSIDASGSARLRTIPSGGGTNMLTADNNGVIRKQALPVASAPTIIGTLGAGATIPSADFNKVLYKYTGASIVIPANSKYIVNAFILATPSTVLNSTQSMWVRSRLCDSPTTYASSPSIVGSSLISGSIGSNSTYGLIQGAIIINNTTNAAKTYYYWVGDIAISGTVYTGALSNFGGVSSGENQLYASPIN